MKKIGLLVTIFLLFMCCNVIYAVNFPSEYVINFSNYEYFNPNVSPGYSGADGNEDNWGIANIDKILDATTMAEAWDDGDNGEYIYAFFYGLDLAYWNTDGSYGMTPTSGGAYMELYLWHDTDPNFESFDLTGVVDASNRNGTTFTGITDGTLLVKFEFTYGVSSDTSIVAAGNTTSSTAPPSGDGQAFLKVVEGFGTAWESFDQDRDALVNVLNGRVDNYIYSQIDPEADLYIKFSYSTGNFNGFNLKSDDPGYGATPEPASIILMGSGLMLIGAVARKKFIKK